MKKVIIFVVFLLIPCNVFAFELKGFGDVDFEKVVGTQNHEYRNGSFILGNIDLYVSEQVNDRLNVLTEIQIEQKRGHPEVERFQITYIYRDYLKILAGRFHTPYGLWNTSFHHGKLLQPTIDRPEILKFESEKGILPLHTVGISLMGQIKTSYGVLSYDFIVGNGDRITRTKWGTTELSPNLDSDDNNNKAIIARLRFRPLILPGLTLSLSGSKQRIQTDSVAISGGASRVNVNQYIAVPAFMYRLNSLNIWGEYFYMRHKSINDETYQNKGYYILFTYSIKDKWVPYLLYEHKNVDKNDTYISALEADMDIKELIAGMRYNISYKHSLKFETRSTKEDNDNFMEFAVQWAIAF